MVLSFEPLKKQKPWVLLDEECGRVRNVLEKRKGGLRPPLMVAPLIPQGTGNLCTCPGGADGQSRGASLTDGCTWGERACTPCGRVSGRRPAAVSSTLPLANIPQVRSKTKPNQNIHLSNPAKGKKQYNKENQLNRGRVRPWPLAAPAPFCRTLMHPPGPHATRGHEKVRPSSMNNFIYGQ